MDLQKAPLGVTLNFLKEFQSEVEDVAREIDQIAHEFHAGLTSGAFSAEIFAVGKFNYLLCILTNFQKHYPLGIQM